MRTRHGWTLAMGMALALGACSSGSEPADAPDPAEASSDTGSASTASDVWALEPFTDLEPGTYFIDPDLDPSTPLRVTYEIPAEGWQSWIGAAKFSADAYSHVGLSITTVSNLVSHGCRDHSWAEPPVGPSVDDLAAALADLAPFRVTSPPEDVSIYGYQGTYLEVTVPEDQPFSDDGNFVGCPDGNLLSWVAAIDTEPGDAFYGYTGPGYTEEF
jgi:hypothetical protein